MNFKLQQIPSWYKKIKINYQGCCQRAIPCTMPSLQSHKLTLQEQL